MITMLRKDPSNDTYSVCSEDTTTDFTAFDGSGKIGDLQSSYGTILAHTSHTPNAGPVFDIGW